jgi:beta-mannosidase
VRYRRRFHAPRTLESHERLWLIFYGLDYFADVHINGVPLGRHQGYFDSFDFDITSLVRSHNELALLLDCPIELRSNLPRLLRAGLESTDPGYAAGIWRGVALEVRSFAYLRDVTLRAELQGSRGKVIVHGLACGNTDSLVELDLSINETVVTRAKAAVAPHGIPFTMDGAMDPVTEWWPNGLGAATMYAVRLEMHGAARTLDCVERRVGFRTIAVYPDNSLAVLNGREVPLCIALPDAASDPLLRAPQLLEPTIDRIAAPHCVRAVHLAGRVADPSAYDWADINGLLLLQDFPWMPGGECTSEEEQEIVRQAGAMARLLSHHPSIAAWNPTASGSPVAGTLVSRVQNAIQFPHHPTASS